MICVTSCICTHRRNLSAFVDSTTLVTCSLLGNITVQNVSYDAEGAIQLQRTWNGRTEGAEKVNAIAVSTNWIAVAGLSMDGKGVTEIWERARGDSASINVNVAEA